MAVILNFRRKTLLIVTAVMILYLMAFAATAAGAVPASSPLTLNGSGSGTINATKSSEYWSITTTADGSLTVTVNADTSLYCSLYLFDTNGSNQITSSSSGWESNRTINCPNLQAGTYYVKVARDGDGSGNYRISNTLTVPTIANDQEANDSQEQALDLPINGSLTGHLGYYKNATTDFQDWYKVTTTTDGSLTIKTNQVETLTGLEIYFYDSDGKTQLTTDTSGYSTSRTVTRPDLKPGTYYIKVDHYTSGYYGTYSISSQFTPQPLGNDQEANDSWTTAQLMLPNSTGTGHLGYYIAGSADFEDWYHISLPADGKLIINTSEDASLNSLELFLFDSDGSSRLMSDTSGYPLTRSITCPNLKAGTYYIKVDRYTGGYYGGYTISNVYTPQPLTNDNEPNDSKDTALSLAYNSSQTGHLGYFGNKVGEFADWYKITSSDGQVQIKVTGDLTLNGIVMYLYDNNGSQVASDTSGYTNIRQITKNNLSAGTYYIQINHYTTGYYGGYNIEYGPNPQPVDNGSNQQNYTLQLANNGQGTLSLASNISYPAGTQISVTATAAQGWNFKQWQGDASGSSNPLLITMDKNKSITAVFEATTNPGSDDWSQQTSVLRNQSEAALVVRTGDIDNLNFGWPSNFNPFSGETTPSHAYPWDVDPADAAGTDRIMVISSYNGNPPSGQDGYAAYTSRPANKVTPIILQYDLQGLPVSSAQLQLFVDDFQASVWKAAYQVSLNGKRATFLEDVINSLVQTGPVGKLITVQVPSAFLADVSSGTLSILMDDPVTGAGDGYAIDFVRLLVNPIAGSYQNTGVIQGTVTNANTNLPVAYATVSAGAGLVTAVSDTKGQFILAGVPAGLVSLQVSASGYNSLNQTIDLETGQTASAIVKLTPLPESDDYQNLTPGSGSYTQKTWTVKFNQAANLSTVNDTTIFVMDAAGQKLTGVVIKVAEDGLSATIAPPSSGYSVGQTYTIRVTTGIITAQGTALKQETRKQFTVTS